MKDPKVIADKYFDRYSKLTDSSNKIIVITLLVLIANWLLIVENNFTKFKSHQLDIRHELAEVAEVYGDIKHQYRALNIRFKQSCVNEKIASDSIRQPLALKKLKLERIRQSYQLDGIKLDSTVKSVNNEAFKIGMKEVDVKEKLSTLKDVPSLVNFIFMISDGVNGGLILNVLFFGLMLYVLSVRRISLKYLAKALRIYKIESSLQLNVYLDNNLPSPIWLVPLPSMQNKDVDPLELKAILGKRYNHHGLQTILLLLMILVVLIQIRLAYIMFMLNGTDITAESYISVVFVALTATVAAYWLRPIKVEDNFNHEENPNALSWRDVLLIVGAVCCIVGIYLVFGVG